MTTIALSALGSRVDVSVGGRRAEEAEQAILAAWRWCLTDPSPRSGPADARLRVVLDDDPKAATATEKADIASTSAKVLMHWLSQKVTVACIDRQAGQLLMMHACALADPTTGRAIAAVAPSGTGKTTFVTTLGRGRVYLSDETVGLREDLEVVPHPKPMSVPTDDGYKDQVEPGTLGLLEPARDSALSAVWFLERSEDASNRAWRPSASWTP